MQTDTNPDWRWPGGSCRLFIGVSLQPSQQQQIATVLQQIPAVLKPVPAENLHLTLRFLGQSTEAQARELWQQLSAQRLSTFSVLLHDLLCWPRPAVLCLAGTVIDPRLQRLDAQIQHAARAYPAPQHQLHPHLTLARNAKSIPELPCRLPVLDVSPDQLHLYQSVSTPVGVRYPILTSLALASA